jgi:hypothetical protein
LLLCFKILSSTGSVLLLLMYPTSIFWSIQVYFAVSINAVSSAVILVLPFSCLVHVLLPYRPYSWTTQLLCVGHRPINCICYMSYEIWGGLWTVNSEVWSGSGHALFLAFAWSGSGHALFLAFAWRWLTAWSNVLLEKLIVAQLPEKFPPFIERLGSLSCSQEPSTFPYPEPDESNQKTEEYLRSLSDQDPESYFINAS